VREKGEKVEGTKRDDERTRRYPASRRKVYRAIIFCSILT